jgi:hypothetical protein
MTTSQSASALFASLAFLASSQPIAACFLGVLASLCLIAPQVRKSFEAMQKTAQVKYIVTGTVRKDALLVARQQAPQLGS